MRTLRTVLRRSEMTPPRREGELRDPIAPWMEALKR